MTHENKTTETLDLIPHDTFEDRHTSGVMVLFRGKQTLYVVRNGHPKRDEILRLITESIGKKPVRVELDWRKAAIVSAEEISRNDLEV